jgi:MFS family permease
MIVHLLCTFLFAIGSVIFGWIMGHFGWISLAFYSGGGLAGLLLAYPLVMLLRLRFAAGEKQPSDDLAEVAA